MTSSEKKKDKLFFFWGGGFERGEKYELSQTITMSMMEERTIRPLGDRQYSKKEKRLELKKNKRLDLVGIARERSILGLIKLRAAVSFSTVSCQIEF